MRKSQLVPEILSRLSMKSCLSRKMKLTYEQMRLLSEIGDTHSNVTIKSRKGHVLRAPIKKWGNKDGKDGKSMSSPEPQRPFHAPMVSHSPIYPQASCLQHPRLAGKR